MNKIGLVLIFPSGDNVSRNIQATIFLYTWRKSSRVYTYKWNCWSWNRLFSSMDICCFLAALYLNPLSICEEVPIMTS